MKQTDIMLTTCDKTGVLLVNLGTPKSFNTKDVRTYLAEFLMDKYVLDVPYLLRLFLVYVVILPFRPKKSAEAYKSIWWKDGSPLMVLSQRLLKACQKKSKYNMALGMRYDSPSIKAGIETLLEQMPEMKKVFLVPLYPHYAMASYETVVEKTKTVLDKHFPELIFESLEPFYNKKPYIDVLSKSITPYKDKVDYILFSYNGITVRHLKKRDLTKSHCYQNKNCCNVVSEAHSKCYKHQCVQATYDVVKTLGLDEDKWGISFQSRLGSDPWIEPFTDKTIESLAKKGIKRLAVVCPAFVSDCLETLEEMGEEGKEIFQESGGQDFYLIDCLNTNEDWVDVLVNMIEEKLN